MDADEARHQRYQSDEQLNAETLAQRIGIPVRDYRPEFLDHFFFIGIAIETGLERGLQCTLIGFGQSDEPERLLGAADRS
jgi:hypothetical protein